MEHPPLPHEITPFEMIAQAKEELVRRNLSGSYTHPDPGNFIRLVGIYKPRVLAILKQYGLRYEEREDCLQEVWLAIIQHLPAFEHPGRGGAFRAWLKRLTRNTAANFLRRKFRHATASLDQDQEAVVPDDRSLPPKVLERKEQIDLVLETLEVMRPSYSDWDVALFHLHWFEGLPVRKIAEQLGMPRRAVSDALYKIMREFRLRFGEPD